MHKNWAKILLALIFILLPLWFFRPFLQPFVMHFVIHPLQIILLLLIIVACIDVAKAIYSSKILTNKNEINKFWGIRISIYTLVFIALILASSIEEELRYWITSQSTSFETRQTLPKFEPIRLTPKSVAQRYAEDSFQSPQEFLGDSQIVLVDGKLQRVFPRLPDGFILRFINKLAGFVLVGVDTPERQVSIVDQKFEFAEQLAIFDNLYFQLPLKKYFVTFVKEPIYLKDDKGEWVTAVPYISYSGFLIRTPYWGGVMVIHSDGSIQDFDASQAQEVSYLKGNRIYPKELAVYYSNSYSYKGGLFNKWFLHKNEIEVVNLPNDEDVLHVASVEGYKQMVVAEPYGKAYGIYKIFFYDATTGKREIIEYDQNTQLTGPVAAADYIKKEFPTFDWSAFRLAEPRPLSVNGELYWLLSVVPHDNAGIAATVLLNTKTNRVIRADTLGELQTFLQTGEIKTETPQGDKAKVQQKLEDLQKQLNELKELLD